MSKPRYIWWGYVKALIRAAGNPRSRKYAYLSEAEIAAFQSVWESTDQERQRLVAMVLIRQSHTIPGAALKLRRAITGTNPTPASEDEALHNLYEEIIDVSLAEKVYFEKNKREHLLGASGLIANGKAYRWAQRIKERKKHE